MAGHRAHAWAILFDEGANAGCVHVVPVPCSSSSHTPSSILPAQHSLHIMQISMQKRKLLNLPSSPTRAEMLATFRRAAESKAFLQEEAARDLGVKQGQVSKIIRGQFVYPTGLPSRLYEYANARLTERNSGSCHGGGAANREVESMRKVLTDRLMDAWDETPDGAEALAVILDGAAKLRRLQEG